MNRRTWSPPIVSEAELSPIGGLYVRAGVFDIQV